MKVLVVGINTRPVANSAKRLGCRVYSVSYYNPVDLEADVKEYFINDMYHGPFSENYDSRKLIECAEKYVDEVDYIFICSGVFEYENSKTPNWDVVGNSPKKIKMLSNKYYVMKKLKNLGCPVPETYIAHSPQQLERYLQEYKKVVVKPIYGHGGRGVLTISLNMGEDKYSNLLKNLKYPCLVQEYILSESFSVAYIGREFITFNKQLVKNNSYSGCITPYNLEKLLDVKYAKEIFEDIIEFFDLKGMNGIDFMIKDRLPVIVEINPRIPGTFETVEMALQCNLVKQIIESVEGSRKPLKVKPVRQYIKKILCTERRVIAYIKKRENIVDVPKYGAVIEKGEPLTTVIGRNMEEVNRTVEEIWKMVVPW
ncbi:MAG TPA: ATP-grasp domain-containing protein [Methanothermococcus okinawensis]|uniref:ATP-grasp domain-containing protein n=1 Tax=Methanothermococcus okinawensis TaxID=155863 RepID=A0A832ZDY6_9EURY|nr:ATP-grasp domain-containing protein [Methanothermococcus okinawensis]